MAVPDFQTLMLPTLRAFEDGAAHRIVDLRETIAKQFQLTQEDRAERLKSGTGLFTNRVAWALAYFGRAKLLDNVAPGIYRLTDRGRDFLETAPSQVTVKMLHRFPEVAGMYPRKVKASASADAVSPATETPEEVLEQTIDTLRKDVAREVLAAVNSVSAAAFERIVVDLLLGMGYGGAVKGAGRVIGRPGDGGVDGTIKQDKLGLDVVYVQAKRWRDNVGSPEVMRFCGSLTAHHAAKGVMITTSEFSRDAIEYVRKVPQKIILIGGRELADLMVEHGVGVATQQTLEVKRLDRDYFDNLD